MLNDIFKNTDGYPAVTEWKIGYDMRLIGKPIMCRDERDILISGRINFIGFNGNSGNFHFITERGGHYVANIDTIDKEALPMTMSTINEICELSRLEMNSVLKGLDKETGQEYTQVK